MFSSDARDEIAAVRFECARCAPSFLRALAAFGGAHAARPDGKLQILVTDRAAVARAALRAGKLAGIALKAAPSAGRRFGHGTFELCSDAASSLARRTPRRMCCRRAWLRGAFLACGSVADPHRTYHLEFYCHGDDAARALTQGLASLGIDVGVTRRRGRPLVYVKGAPAVADVLGLMGAARAVLALDDLLAMRYTKNVTQRRVNSEAANAARSATTGARQRAAALRVGRGRLAHALTAALREAARLRIAHPEHTLAELAAAARPPVSKAAMAYRLREIERLA